jgi:aminoglycoside phosphotransferase (APT) family kinase protein
MGGFVDDPRRHVSGWRKKLAADANIDALFRSCELRVGELTESCPERDDLVHGDLLHANVLINEDASRVNAVFSWKCSTRGDFLFDTAWCTFWGAFHPGVAAADIFHRIVREPSIADDPGGLDGAAERHHCYELQIGARHLGWNAWVGDQAALEAVAAHTAVILERGPLTM